MGKTDADAVDATVGAGKDFKTEAIFFHYLARKWDVPRNLGDQAPQCGRFIVLRQT